MAVGLHVLEAATYDECGATKSEPNPNRCCYLLKTHCSSFKTRTTPEQTPVSLSFMGIATTRADLRNNRSHAWPTRCRADSG